MNKYILSNNYGYLILTYLIPLLVIGSSVYIHGVLREYSDIYSITLDISRGDTVYGIPYRDFRFEYPPFIGFLWAMSSLVTKLVIYISHNYDPVIVHVYVLFFINAFFYILYISAIETLVREYDINGSFAKILLSIASFSIIYYLMYNWDIVAISLAMWSLVYLFKRRYLVSSFILGLSVLSKIFTGVFVLPYLYYIHKVEGDNARYKAPATLLFFLETVLLGFSLFMLLFPKAFQDFLSHHATWYCENCFYILFVDNIWDPLWRSISQALMLSLPLLVTLYILVKNENCEVEEKTLYASLISLASLISVSYVYSPQMNISITPLFLITGFLETLLLLLSDLLNTLIMIFWFRGELFREYLAIPYSDPHLRTSPIQWMAFTRIILLWIVIALLLRRINRSYSYT
ncbi:MAG: hypothetical protein ACP5GI_02510 [Sulfolobales archaeon]